MTKRVRSAVKDEMRAEYDFSSMKFVGRGIYAERYREGVKFFFVSDDENAEEELHEQPRNISDPVEWSTHRDMNE